MRKKHTTIISHYDDTTLFAIIIAFVFCPFISTLLAIYYAFHNKNWLFLLIVVLFLALFNLTINPRQTDYSWYLPLYSNAQKKAFVDYVFSLSSAKEPLYTILNYLLCHIFMGSRILFSIFSTAFFYIFSLLGLKKTSEIVGVNNNVFCLAAIAFLFFPYIFANSANLLRQYWATGLILYSLPHILNGQRKYWIIAFISVFIHTSSGIIVLLAAIPFFSMPLSWRSLVIYIIAFLFMLNLAKFAESISAFFMGTILEYALVKAMTETTFKSVYTIGKFLFSAIIVVIPLLTINISKLRKNRFATHFINIQFFVLLYIAANFNQAELCERLNMFFWCAMPFNIIIVFSQIKPQRIYQKLLIISFIGMFLLYELLFTTYDYQCKETFLFQPSWFYFMQNQLYIVK